MRVSRSSATATTSLRQKLTLPILPSKRGRTHFLSIPPCPQKDILEQRHPPAPRTSSSAALALELSSHGRSVVIPWRTHSCVPRRPSCRRPVPTCCPCPPGCRDESRHGTHECVRHNSEQYFAPIAVIPLAAVLGPVGVQDRIANVFCRVDAGARPGPVPGQLRQARAHRIEVGVAQSAHQVRFVQRAGKETVLPKRKSTRLNSSHLGISYAV